MKLYFSEMERIKDYIKNVDNEVKIRYTEVFDKDMYLFYVDRFDFTINIKNNKDNKKNISFYFVFKDGILSKANSNKSSKFDFIDEIHDFHELFTKLVLLINCKTFELY